MPYELTDDVLLPPSPLLMRLNILFADERLESIREFWTVHGYRGWAIRMTWKHQKDTLPGHQEEMIRMLDHYRVMLVDAFRKKTNGISWSGGIGLLRDGRLEGYQRFQDAFYVSDARWRPRLLHHENVLHRPA